MPQTEENSQDPQAELGLETAPDPTPDSAPTPDPTLDPTPDPPDADPQSSQPSDSDSPEPESEPESEQEPEPSEDPPDEPEQADEPTVSISYESVDDIRLSEMPEIARKYMEPALEILARRDASLIREQSNYEMARKELSDVTDSLQMIDGEDRKPLVEALEANQTTISRLSDDVVSTSWDAFQRLHPEAKTLPQKVQLEVGKQFGGLGTRFSDGSTLQQMEDAYAFALYKSGHNPEKVSQPTIETKRQAVVADGSQATSPSRVGVDEMDWDELMEKHEHLL